MPETSGERPPSRLRAPGYSKYIEGRWQIGGVDTHGSFGACPPLHCPAVVPVFIVREAKKEHRRRLPDSVSCHASGTLRARKGRAKGNHRTSLSCGARAVFWVASNVSAPESVFRGLPRLTPGSPRKDGPPGARTLPAGQKRSTPKTREGLAEGVEHSDPEQSGSWAMPAVHSGRKRTVAAFGPSSLLTLTSFPAMLQWIQTPLSTILRCLFRAKTME